VLVEVLDKSVHVLEVHPCVGEGEVTSEGDHNVVSSEGIS
jgi:hypothetical protein